jgi:hypothetical protein
MKEESESPSTSSRDFACTASLYTQASTRRGYEPWPQLRAAVEAGADAVYFGLKHFTARAKVGFQLSEPAEVMATLHGRIGLL